MRSPGAATKEYLQGTALDGSTIVVGATVAGPANVLEGAVCEALATIAAKAESGRVDLRVPGGEAVVAAGGERSFASYRGPIEVTAGHPRMECSDIVDASPAKVAP